MSVSTNLLEIKTFAVGSFACNASIIYSKQSREAIVIDPGNNIQEFLSVLTPLNVNVKALVHTHAHFDHIGRSNSLSSLLKAPIYLHQDDLFLYNSLKSQGLWVGEDVDEPNAKPLFLNDAETFGFSDKALKNFLKTIHTPGHTPGSCSFYMELTEKPVLFSGDTLFASSIGRTDLPGGNHSQIIHSIKDRLLPLPGETLCIPGHGKTTHIYDEKKRNPFLA